MSQSSLDADVAFQLLSNARRRHIIYLLADRGERLSLQTIATELMTWVNDETLADGPDNPYRSIYVSLYQNHIPRLADAGVVSYDEEDRTASLRNTAETRMILRLLGCDFFDRRRRLFDATFGLSALLGVLVVSGVLPFAGAGWIVPALVLIGGVLAVEFSRPSRQNHIVLEGQLGQTGY